MSWDCSVCGKGNGYDHDDCYRAKEISGSMDDLKDQIADLTDAIKELKKLLEAKHG